MGLIGYSRATGNLTPLVMVRLDEVDVERLAELVTDAWQMRAPEEIADRF